MSFIAAITQHEVIGSQIIEGAFDATLFEAFVFKLLNHVRADPKTATKTVVLFMDNAVVHRHSSVLETCKRLKVNVVFNAEYSPWLNPVEQLFGYVKG
jgi:transposase